MLLLIATMPVAVVTTFLLLPVWRWLERTTGMELVGHSGPAGWCYAFIHALLTFAALPVLFREWRRRRKPGRAVGDFHRPAP